MSNVCLKFVREDGDRRKVGHRVYPIRRAAELSGVPADTIRVWERRYGVPRPRRTASGYRIYSVEDVRLLERMRELVHDGVSPSRAATILGGAAGALLPTLTPTEFVARIAAGEYPQQELERLLQAAATQRAWAELADQWLMPMLQELGDAWADQSITLVHEHAVSAMVIRHLTAAYYEVIPSTGPVVLLGLPPGELHEIGLLLFAVVLRSAGVDARYLGADLDAAAWTAAIDDARPLWAISASYLPDTDQRLRQLVEELVRVPDLHIGLGGRGQVEVPGAEPLGSNFGPALSLVLEKLPRARA